MKHWRIQTTLALGALCLLVSTLFYTPAKANNLIAQEADEGFLHPYQGQNFYWTNGAQNGQCHTDGYGNFLANVPGPCSVDFTHYSGGEKINCGAPAMAPVSGEFSNLGLDNQGNTLGVLKGSRYWVLMLHGDFVASGYLSQGNIIGYENTHGNSTACHWHMDVFDVQANQWVNPTTMQLVSSLPSGAGVDVSPNVNDEMIQKIKAEAPGAVTVQPGYLDGLFSITPTQQVVQDPNSIAVTTPTPGASEPGTSKIIEITNPQTGEPLGSWKLDWSKLPFRINTERLGAIWSQYKAVILIGFGLLLVILFSSSPNIPTKEG